MKRTCFEPLESRHLLSALPVISIEASAPVADEATGPDSLTGLAGQFTVTRDVMAATPLKIKLAIGGTATNGKDYVRIPKTVTIPANQTSVTVAVTPFDDGQSELLETVIISISQSPKYTVSQVDFAETVTIADAEYTAADYWPLTEGLRLDYLVSSDGNYGSWTFTAGKDGQNTTLSIDGWAADDEIHSVAVLKSSAQGLLETSSIEDGDVFTKDAGELWLPTNMVVGQSYSLTSTQVLNGKETGTVSTTITIVGVETISVPAGTFRALKVVNRNAEAMPGWNDEEIITWWLVRGLGAVKFTDRGTDYMNRDSWSITGALTSWSTDSEWSSLANMPVGLDAHSGTVINGKIYVFGGNFATGGKSNELRVYDPDADSWSLLASNPHTTGVRNMSAATVDGKMYVFGAGGQDAFGNSQTVNLAEEYDPSTDTWTSKAPKPTPVEDAPCVVYDGEIYVFGGITVSGGRQTPCRKVEAYNPATNTWRLVGNMPKAVYLPAIAVVGDQVYLIGGAVGKPGNQVWAYNFTINRWNIKDFAPMPQGQVCSIANAAPTADGKIYILGGQQGSANFNWATSVVRVYDTVTNTWSKLPSMPMPNGHALLSVTCNDVLYVVGGLTWSQRGDAYALDDVWSLPLT